MSSGALSAMSDGRGGRGRTMSKMAYAIGGLVEDAMLLAFRLYNCRSRRKGKRGRRLREQARSLASAA